ncbi:hypothetical protein KR093_001671, partial [Drosophila rubida]
MKMANMEKVFDNSDYPALLTTLSLKEVMVLEFRFIHNGKWENMVMCKDNNKNMYLCNVCNVFQYGDKNLYSHLAGKKHIMKMELVRNIRLPKGIGSRNTTKKANSHQMKTVPKNITETPSTFTKDTNKSVPNIQPSKNPVGTAAKSVAAKPQAVSSPKPSAANCSVATISKPTATKAPAKPLAAKTPVASTSKPIATKAPVANGPVKTTDSNPPVAATSNSIATNVGSTLPVEEKVVSTKLDRNIEATNSNMLSNDQRPQLDGNTSVSTTFNSLVQENLKKSTSTTKRVSDDVEIQTPCEETNAAEETNFSTDVLTNNFESSVLHENKTETEKNKVSKHPLKLNLVKNPAKVAKEKQISCVPLSKLVNAQSTEKVNNAKNENNDDDDEVILLDPEIDPCSHTAQANNNGGDEIKVITPTPMDVNYLPSSTLTFDNSKNMTEILGLIGVEYVLKIVRSISSPSPRFICSLCEITADEISMHNHLISINHRLKYCEKHFPTTIRQYRQQISHIPEHQVFKVLTPILNKIAIAIETHHGRENAYHCYEHWFNKNKKSLYSTVLRRRHASEQNGPAFTHVVDANEVDMFIENANNKVDQPMGGIIRISNHEPPHHTFNNSNTFRSQQPTTIHKYANNYLKQSNNQPQTVEAVDDETHKRLVENFLRDTRQSQPARHRHEPRVSKRNRSRSITPERKRKRSSSLMGSQWNVDRRSVSPLRDGDIWQAYRHLVDHSVREVNSTFDLYKSDPEQHPLYKDEWQKFWKRRKDELIASGINHRTYNYQNEWILFFNARLEELYSQRLENIKVKCRERLCLPMTNKELTDPKYHVNICDELQEPELAPESQTENFVEHQRKPVEHCRELSPKSKPRENREEVNVIHVLRLLTALEDYLGSLGPSITELLAKALQISKIHPEKVNNLILTNENCVILETAKEKFTGLIISKMLETNQERALKKAVNDTEALLEFAAKISTHCPNENVETEISTAGQTLGNMYSSQDFAQKTKSTGSYKISDQIDKTDLAAKLASSLISQGKTKINPEQLKQIIQVYSLIEQKKLQEPSLTSTPTENHSTNIETSTSDQFTTPHQQSFNSNHP